MIDLEKIAYDIGVGKSQTLTRWMLPIATLEEMISLIHKQEAELLEVRQAYEDRGVVANRLINEALLTPNQHVRPDLTSVIHWLEGGCDPIQAAQELRAYQKQMGLPDVSILLVQQHAQADDSGAGFIEQPGPGLDHIRELEAEVAKLKGNAQSADRSCLGGNDAQAALSDGPRLSIENCIAQFRLYADMNPNPEAKHQMNFAADFLRDHGPVSDACGWIQFIDGVQSQNFCRDEAELKGCKDIAEIFAKGKNVEYVQVFRGVAPAPVAAPVAAAVAQGSLTITKQFASAVLGALFNGPTLNPWAFEQIKQAFAAIMRGEKPQAPWKDALAAQPPADAAPSTAQGEALSQQAAVELPEAHNDIIPMDLSYDVYTASQMHEFYQQGRAAGIEQAAKVAESVGRPVGAGDGGTYIPGTSADAARAIRALNKGG